MDQTEIYISLTKLNANVENMGQDIQEIKVDVKNKCNDCVNAAIAKEKLKNQWYHISALWGAIVGLGGALYMHITGK